MVYWSCTDGSWLIVLWWWLMIVQRVAGQKTSCCWCCSLQMVSFPHVSWWKTSCHGSNENPEVSPQVPWVLWEGHCSWMEPYIVVFFVVGYAPLECTMINQQSPTVAISQSFHGSDHCSPSRLEHESGYGFRSWTGPGRFKKNWLIWQHHSLATYIHLPKTVINHRNPLLYPRIDPLGCLGSISNVPC